MAAKGRIEAADFSGMTLAAFGGIGEPEYLVRRHVGQVPYVVKPEKVHPDTTKWRADNAPKPTTETQYHVDITTPDRAHPIVDYWGLGDEMATLERVPAFGMTAGDEVEVSLRRTNLPKDVKVTVKSDGRASLELAIDRDPLAATAVSVGSSSPVLRIKAPKSAGNGKPGGVVSRVDATVSAPPGGPDLVVASLAVRVFSLYQVRVWLRRITFAADSAGFSFPHSAAMKVVNDIWRQAGVEFVHADMPDARIETARRISGIRLFEEHQNHHETKRRLKAGEKLKGKPPKPRETGLLSALNEGKGINVYVVRRAYDEPDESWWETLAITFPPSGGPHGDALKGMTLPPQEAFVVCFAQRPRPWDAGGDVEVDKSPYAFERGDDPAVRGLALAHELGHYFGMLHAHREDAIRHPYMTSVMMMHNNTPSGHLIPPVREASWPNNGNAEYLRYGAVFAREAIENASYRMP